LEKVQLNFFMFNFKNQRRKQKICKVATYELLRLKNAGTHISMVLT
jgi:hypothetical protein